MLDAFIFAIITTHKERLFDVADIKVSDSIAQSTGRMQ